MQLTILGNSGTFPAPGRPCSSYLVEHEGFRLLVDAGNGALGALQAHCGLLDVDAIVLSHLHGDHCLDLVAYSYARRYHPDGMAPRLPVWGPRGTQRRLCGAFETWPSDQLDDVFDFHELAVGTVEVGPFAVTADHVSHPIDAFGLRITAGGRSLAYSGDTAPCDPLDALAAGVDVFLCEASWLHSADNPVGVHMSGREAGESATRATVGRLLLTHIVPWVDPQAALAEAASTFSGHLGLAEQGCTYDV